MAELTKLAMSMAHNIVTELSAKNIAVGLTKAEVLLHDQACNTLQGFLRIHEIEMNRICDERLQEIEKE